MSDRTIGGADRPPVTYFTIADSSYFLGAAALINSLELTGNRGNVLVVDAGLEPWQRTSLERVAKLMALDAPGGIAPAYYKAYMGASIEGEVVVCIDSDIIVTDSLDDVVSLAAAGYICAARDGYSQRYFEEWASLLPLHGTLRRQPYVNSGFVALAPARWPSFYPRWRELCEAILAHAPPLHALSVDDALRDATGFHDQDALNALLMSEVPEGTLVTIEDGRVAARQAELASVRCVDPLTLECRSGQARTLFLHYLSAPKPWQRSGWMTMRDNAYVQLLPRLLCADDVPVRLSPDQVPVWLRGGGIGRRGFLIAGRGARAAARVLPAGLRTKLRFALARRFR